MGRLHFETRLPMVPLLPENEKKLTDILKTAGLI